MDQKLKSQEKPTRRLVLSARLERHRNLKLFTKATCTQCRQTPARSYWPVAVSSVSLSGSFTLVHRGKCEPHLLTLSSNRAHFTHFIWYILVALPFNHSLLDVFTTNCVSRRVYGQYRDSGLVRATKGGGGCQWRARGRQFGVVIEQ